MRLLRYGEAALLAEVDAPLAFAAAAAELDDVIEVVPAARTVLVLAADADALPRLRDALSTLHPNATATATGDVITLDVRYDGPDLSSTAAELDLDTDALVRAHLAGDYTVAFCGFAPGFAYLTGLAPTLHVARLPDPRSAVPAGSVGIAGEFTGVYPRSSPGGWRLLGTTDAALWDIEHDPPALLAPATRVAFRAIT